MSEDAVTSPSYARKCAHVEESRVVDCTEIFSRMPPHHTTVHHRRYHSSPSIRTSKLETWGDPSSLRLGLLRGTATMPKANVRKTQGVSRSVNSSQPSRSRFLRNKPPTIHNMSALALERGISKNDFRKQFSSTFKVYSPTLAILICIFRTQR
jgi:hypothetical protein